MTDTDNRLWTRFRWAMWGGAAFLLLLPLLARAPWTGSDYLMMAVLLAVACGTVELGIGASRDGAYRLGSLVAAGSGFLLTWVNLAVGFLGDERNPANLIFMGVLAVAVAGTVVARADPARMARTMFVTAGAQAAAGCVGWAIGLASPEAVQGYEVAMGTALFCGLWLLSAALFLRSVRTTGATAV